MKPSNSKSAVAARVAKHRRIKKEKAERDKRAADDFGKLSTLEQIAVHDIVKANKARVKAEAPARVAAVIAKAEAKARKEEQLTVARKDSDGRLVYERIPIPQHRGTVSTEVPKRSAPAPVIVVDNGRPCQGQGDPAIKKVLIQRRGTGRKEWCLPDQVPSGAHVFNPEERGSTGFAYGIGLDHMQRGQGSVDKFGWPSDSI